MCGGDTPSKEQKRSAAGVFARLVFQSVQSESPLPGKWHDDAFKPEAIDEERSASIMELRLAKWSRFRLSIHSDDGGSSLGYGVFCPTNMNRRSDDQGIREYLAARVPDGGMGTPRHWAWYRDVDEPLRDFSRPETLSEVAKIRQAQPSKGDDAFRRASDDLARLAEALDGWYSEG
jgi:hypothetical protein